MKYRFTPEDFEPCIFSMSAMADDAKRCAEKANAKLEQWEKESEKIYGFWCPIAKLLKFWTPRGPAKLKRDDFTHSACIWNPKPFEAKK